MLGFSSPILCLAERKLKQVRAAYEDTDVLVVLGNDAEKDFLPPMLRLLSYPSTALPVSLLVFAAETMIGKDTTAVSTDVSFHDLTPFSRFCFAARNSLALGHSL